MLSQSLTRHHLHPHSTLRLGQRRASHVEGGREARDGVAIGRRDQAAHVQVQPRLYLKVRPETDPHVQRDMVAHDAKCILNFQGPTIVQKCVRQKCVQPNGAMNPFIVMDPSRVRTVGMGSVKPLRGVALLRLVGTHRRSRGAHRHCHQPSSLRAPSPRGCSHSRTSSSLRSQGAVRARRPRCGAAPSRPR